MLQTTVLREVSSHTSVFPTSRITPSRGVEVPVSLDGNLPFFRQSALPALVSTGVHPVGLNLPAKHRLKGG